MKNIHDMNDAEFEEVCESTLVQARGRVIERHKMLEACKQVNDPVIKDILTYLLETAKI
jgi:hypothetical protein